MAKAILERPNIRFRKTDPRAAAAPTARAALTHRGPAAAWRGAPPFAASAKASAPIEPTATAVTPMYRSAANASETTRAIGMLRLGFSTSSPKVAIRPYPA